MEQESRPDALSRGSRLGRYRVIRKLGGGGEGQVYLVVHEQTEQVWAAKILHACGPERWHELNVMKKLHHPSLPRVIDVLELESPEGPSLCLIMEYVRGRSLEEIRREKGRLSEQQVIDAGLQMCRALSYLHERREPVLHLDLKPENMICRSDGRIVLVDFGAAERISEEAGGARRGTDGYAAPEQYDRTRPLDARTDIYGLGASLYYLASGVRYSRAMIKSKVPGCPDRLGQIIRHCLAEDPDDRYPCASKMAADLMRLRRSEQSQKRRTRLWAALVLVIITGALAGHALISEFAQVSEKQWDYDMLVQEAECAPLEQARAYLLKAVYIRPRRARAYLAYLDLLSADGQLTEQEDEQLRELLHTIPYGSEDMYEEMIAQAADEYALLSCRLGLIYWYEYASRTEGRRIAAGWFGKAAAAAEEIRLQEMPERVSAEAGTEGTDPTQESVTEGTETADETVTAQETVTEGAVTADEAVTAQEAVTEGAVTAEKTVTEGSTTRAGKTMKEGLPKTDEDSTEAESNVSHRSIASAAVWNEDWETLTRIYYDMSRYDDTLLPMEGDEEDGGSSGSGHRFASGWQDLEELIILLSGAERGTGIGESHLMRSICMDCLAQIITCCTDWYDQGVTAERMLEAVGRLEEMGAENTGEEVDAADGSTAAGEDELAWYGRTAREILDNLIMRSRKEEQMNSS